MKIVTIGKYEFLVIENNQSRIVSDNECIHEFNPESVFVDENKEIKRDGKTYIQFGQREYEINHFLNHESREISLSELEKWIRYFGIKSRIAENYHLLKCSCREIGVNTSDFPTWRDNK